MSKEREELNKKKSEQKKNKLKTNLLKAGGILVAIGSVIVGAKTKKS